MSAAVRWASRVVVAVIAIIGFVIWGQASRGNGVGFETVLGGSLKIFHTVHHGNVRLRCEW